MKELRIDRERAIKVAAMAGLVLLGLSILPGLLKTPEAPELPPDVGFTAAEGGPGTMLPSPDRTAAERSRSRPRPAAERRKRADRGRAERTRRASHKPERRPSGALKKDDKSKNEPDSPQPAAIPSSPAAPAPATPAPAPVTPAQPPAVSAPPPATPAPAPAPPAPPPTPADGSQEFAPR